MDHSDRPPPETQHPRPGPGRFPAARPRPTLEVDRRTIVVLAGLPGAGKSTLLTRLHTTSAVAVLDSEQVRARMRAFLPDRFPYRWYRFFVHLVHRLRIVATCLVVPAPVLAHDPSTRWAARALYVLLGTLTRRRRLLVWLHVDPDLALAGQYARGRLIRSRSFRRHVARVRLLDEWLRTGRPPRGFHEVHVFTRADVRDGLVLDVAPETEARSTR